MNKRLDFGNDILALNNNVAAEVGDVLKALRQKQTTNKAATPALSENGERNPPVSSMPPDEPSEPALRKPRSSTTPRRSRLKAMIERDVVLENVTTRLRRETNELLTETALRQRLKKVSPATRQDIVEAALDEWFRKHGYALDRESESDSQ
jgi:hypothetical protein